MNEEKTVLARWNQHLDEIGGRLKEKTIEIPTEIVGAALFLILAVVLLLAMPQQVTVSDADVVNGRVFPTMLMVIMIVCCAILLVQGVIKKAKGLPVPVCRLNLLTEVKALLIMAIMLVTYLICSLTDLFVLGAVFCAAGFLVYFRCRKKLYYVITIGIAVLVWVAFRFGLGVRF